jgi:hypothetical protein
MSGGSSFKVAAGTVAIVGLIFAFIEKKFSPEYIVTDKPFAPEWLGWAAWILTALGTLAYVLIDFLEWRSKGR